MEHGASSVEYATLLSLVAIFLLTGVANLENAADRNLSAVTSALGSHHHYDLINNRKVVTVPNGVKLTR